MKILIVTATWMEVKLLTNELIYIKGKSDIHKEYVLNDKQIDILVTGFGTTFTTFHLTYTLLENKYDMVICVGLAGSLSSDLEIGEVVTVISEEFADLGIESRKGFLTLFEAGFINDNEFPFERGILLATESVGLNEIKKVRGITVNKSHFKKISIAELNEKFIAQVESMEGAAVFYVCNWLGIPCLQIRAISNFIEKEDPMHWNIPLALENLKTSVLKTLNNLAVPVH